MAEGLASERGRRGGLSDWSRAGGHMTLLFLEIVNTMLRVWVPPLSNLQTNGRNERK